MKNEIKVFLTAVMFYTRIPVGKISGWHEELLNKATRYFPLIGAIVGGVSALSFCGLNMVLPLALAVLLSMVTSILLSGAFHEDGFADFCDGFGGGYTSEKILDIMKDSRIGTYGSIGLLMMLGIKFYSLSFMDATRIPLIMISAHAFSRIFPVLLIYTSEYVRLDETSKAKPVGKRDSGISLLIALVCGSAFLSFLTWTELIAVIIFLSIVFIVFRNYINGKLGGYTGDVLGALQQLSEVFFYITILAVQNFN